MAVRNDKVLDFMMSDFPKGSIAYNALKEGADSIRSLAELRRISAKKASGPFTFTCSDIKDPIDCGVYMLKPCIQKYFKDHNYSESTSKVEKQMAIIALCHRIEEGLIDYLDEIEEFNSWDFYLDYFMTNG